MSIKAQRFEPIYISDTSANGQSIRYFPPPETLKGATGQPIVLWSHPHAQTEAVNNSYFLWPLIHAAVNEGWIFAASNMHANSWGNSTGQADVLDLYNKIVSLYGAGPVILIGGSMGGLATANLVASGAVANVKGACSIDGAFDILTMHKNATYTSSIETAYSAVVGTLSAGVSAGATSISSSVSFPSGTKIRIDPNGANPEVVTTTGAPTGAGPYTIPVPALGFLHNSGVGVSDLPAKITGYDPIARSGAAYGATPWRFYASAADTSVSKTANTDAFSTLLGAGPTEKTTVVHTNSHLGTMGCQPRDWVPFVKRCLA